jgi:oxygen-independent coproporphyrinogen III oxidase
LEFHKSLLQQSPYPVSLYIHIPFCVKKCFYCDFFSVHYTRDKARQVISAILEETSFFFRSLPGVWVRTIYIGGGTPSCLDPDLFETLLQGINSLEAVEIKRVGEWTVEANPESVDRKFLLLCKKYYVTRLSLGIQSSDDSLLTLLGRKTTFSDCKKAAALCNRSWDRDVSLDIMTGIPGQTPGMVQEDIEWALEAFHPAHISLYSLTIEKGTELEKQVNNNEIRLPPGEVGEAAWYQGYRVLESHHYTNYEISNFAREGKESLHNLRYWHMDPYIGTGPGAVSTLPGRNSHVIRIYHPDNVHEYCTNRENPWGMTCDIIDPQTFFFETCMMGFRLRTGIPAAKFISRFGKPLPALIPGLWEVWKKKGWAVENPSAWVLTHKGRFLLNTLLEELSDYMESIRTGEIQLSDEWSGHELDDD